MEREYDELVLRIGTSAEKAALFDKLLNAFNEAHGYAEGQSRIQITTARNTRALMDDALAGTFDAVSPDSTMWLDQLEDLWSERTGGERALISEYTVFAVSPVVIVMRASIARRLGYPHEPMGWSTLMEAAEHQEVRFSWSRPHPESGVGLLAALAEFYAAAKKTKDLTQDDIDHPAVRDSFHQAEAAIRGYGASAQEVLEVAVRDGHWSMDAFVAEEHSALALTYLDLEDPPVIIYPQEGTLWAEHALALCAREAETPKREAYDRFRDYLLSANAQTRMLAEGFRPAGPHYQAYLTAAEGRLRAWPHVKPISATAFELPDGAVQVHGAYVARFEKKPTNVYLVVDVSGSMRGDKLHRAKEGLETFIDCIPNDGEQVGLIAFDDRIQHLVPSDVLYKNRALLLSAIADLCPGNETALLDAVAFAHEQLTLSYKPGRIHALVVMTDGHENASRRFGEGKVLKHLRESRRGSRPLVVYCLAYGEDADLNLLTKIANNGGGSPKTGTLENVRSVYEVISGFV